MDPESSADVVRTELVAHVAWTGFTAKHKGKGKSEGKPKGKSYAPKGKSTGKLGIRRKGFKGHPKLSLEERKIRLRKLKKDTKCHDCGQAGRWSGDPECPKKKSLHAHGNLAVVTRGDPYSGGYYD